MKRKECINCKKERNCICIMCDDLKTCDKICQTKCIDYQEPYFPVKMWNDRIDKNV